MPEQKLVEIPLSAGVRTYATGWEIGPQPRIMRNLLRQERSDLSGGRFLDFPAMPETEFDITAKGDAAHTNKYLTGLVYGGDQGMLATGVFDTGAGAHHLGIWRVATNQARHGASTVAVVNDSATPRQPAAMAYWRSQSRVYFAHPKTNSGNIQQLNTSAGTVAAYTTPGSLSGVHALLVHLERLWIGYGSTVAFTDTNDPATIRAANQFTIPDDVMALGRASVGELDSSAQAHLVVGGRDSVWVLDGDPGGIVTLRQLSAGVGIQSPTLMAESPHGLFCLASDGEVYLIPQGAGQMVPMGTPVRDQWSNFNRIPSTNYAGSLLWAAPLLYVFQASAQAMVLDMTNPQEPEWTGPHVPNSAVTSNILGVARAPETSSASDTLWAAPQNAMTPVWSFTTNATGRQQFLQTGYLFEHGKDVLVKRVFLYVTRKTTPARTITVRCFRPDGTSVTKTVTPTLTGSATKDKLDLIEFAFQPVPRGYYLYLEIEGETGERLPVVRALALLETQDRVGRSSVG